ncbi:ABC transporter substrate-binding protein [Clostridia bacterium OttesenSCG-928-O13]|nr:ABC transporter substrate-binding protein [Clostridia bacterium OttesenSCG-928-O13]
MKKGLSLALCLAVCLAMLAGCAGGAASSASTAPVSSAPVSTPVSASAPADDGEYGTVTIQNGERTLTFTEMPTSIMSCHLFVTENLVMLGLEDYIVGRSVPTANEVPLDELADVINAIPEIERSYENAVALGTDFIMGQVSAFADDRWGSYEMFADTGANCYVVSGTIADDETVENIYIDVRALGQIFKVEDRAEELIADIQARIAAVQEKVAEVPEDEKVRVFVMDTFNGNEIYTTSKGLQSNLIELAGGINCTRNMADSRWFTTSVETLVETEPDIIIFNDYGTQTIQEKMDFINNNPALADVPAVKNQAYITVPLSIVMQNVRAASACEIFAEEFYPELFA